jgi:hypothetical protein
LFAERFVFLAGEAAGLSAGEAPSPGLGDASFFAERFAFLAGEALGLSAAAGLSPGEGLWAKAAPAVNVTTTIRDRNFFMMRG